MKRLQLKPGSALLIIGAGLVLACSDGKSTAAGGHPDPSPVWNVGTETDGITDAANPSATLERSTPNGGRVDIEAECGQTTILFSFEYHAKREPDSSLAVGNGYGDIAFVYRFDDGKVQNLLSHSQFKNVATAVFAYEAKEQAPTTSGEAIEQATGGLITALIPAAGAQDLRALLHAKRVRFGLPLGDGTPYVFEFAPNEGSFRRFLAACKINLASVDRDAVTPSQRGVVRGARLNVPAVVDPITHSEMPELSSGQPDVQVALANERALANSNAAVPDGSDGTFNQTIGVRKGPYDTAEILDIAHVDTAEHNIGAASDGYEMVSTTLHGRPVTGYVKTGAIKLDAN